MNINEYMVRGCQIFRTAWVPRIFSVAVMLDVAGQIFAQPVLPYINGSITFTGEANVCAAFQYFPDGFYDVYTVSSVQSWASAAVQSVNGDLSSYGYSGEAVTTPSPWDMTQSTAFSTEQLTFQMNPVEPMSYTIQTTYEELPVTGYFAAGSTGILSIPGYAPTPATFELIFSPADFYTATNECFTNIPFTLSVYAGPPAVSITPLRVTAQQANISSSDNVDMSILPVTDTNVLNLPTDGPILNGLGLGVVADGVTPVLFQINGPPGNYFLSFNNGAVGYTSLSTNLFVLQNGVWVNTPYFSILDPPRPPPPMGVAFAYLQGMDWSTLESILPPSDLSSNDVSLTLDVATTDTNGIAGSAAFRVRPPPIVLVHGYNADSNTWSSNFLSVLTNSRPSDFIIPIQYGVSYYLGFFGVYPDKSVNTSGRLYDLAFVLDKALQQAVEDPASTLHQFWDFTRYDIVAHSQGGVLSRMLCQVTPNGAAAFSSSPVISQQNMYRGRFRRIITIDSPHNGSVLLRYILQMNSKGLLNRTVAWFLSSFAQSKFDPFGLQIAEINNPKLPVDPRMTHKFVCIQTAINDGSPPADLYDGQPGRDIVCYGALGLQTASGAILLPQGSDGVEDFYGGQGRTGTSNMYIDSPDIAHSDVTSKYGSFELFGVPPGHSDTTFPLVAQNITNLLNQGPSAFGYFYLPEPLPASEQASIDAIVPSVTKMDLIYAGGAAKLDLSSNYDFSLEISSNPPTGGLIEWYAQAFGPDGISSDGVIVTVNPTNSSFATVTVSNAVQGTVVLYATYTSNTESLVLANPVVVVEHPVGTVLIGIELHPPSASLSIGEMLPLEVWGDYTNGLGSLLYLGPGEIAYESSDTNIASVDADGIVTLNSPGTATILASYGGFTNQTVVSSVSPFVSGLSGAVAANGLFQLSFVATLGSTNIVENSSDLINWAPLATIYNTNGLIQYEDVFSTNLLTRFYRVVIP